MVCEFELLTWRLRYGYWLGDVDDRSFISNEHRIFSPHFLGVIETVHVYAQPLHINKVHIKILY